MCIAIAIEKPGRINHVEVVLETAVFRISKEFYKKVSNMTQII